MGLTSSSDSSTDSSSRPSSSITGTQYVTSRRFSHALRHNSTIHNRLFDATASHVLDYLIDEDDQLARFARTRVKFTRDTIVVSNVSIPSFDESGVVIKTRENSDVILRIVLKSKFENSDGKILIGKDLVNEMRRRVAATITASFAIYPNMTTLTVAIGSETGYYDSVASGMGIDFARFPFVCIDNDMRNVIVPEKVKRILIAIKSPHYTDLSVMRIFSLDKIFSYPSRTEAMGIGPNRPNENEWGKYVNPILEKLRDDTKVFFERFKNRNGTTDSYVRFTMNVPNVYYPLPHLVYQRPASKEMWMISVITPKQAFRDNPPTLQFVKIREVNFKESLRYDKRKVIIVIEGEFVSNFTQKELERNVEFLNIMNDDSNDDYKIGFERSTNNLIIHIVAVRSLNPDALISSVKEAKTRIVGIVSNVVNESKRTYEMLQRCVTMLTVQLLDIARECDTQYANLGETTLMTTIASTFYDFIDIRIWETVREVSGINVPEIDPLWTEYLMNAFIREKIDRIVRNYRTASGLIRRT